MATAKQAIEIAKRGPAVFRIKAGTKGGEGNYIDPQWREGQSTTDTFDLFNRFNGRDHNIGVFCGDNFVVIDVDKKNGGLEEWERIVSETGPLPRTWTVRTPSGGLHVYFATGGERFGAADLVKGKINVRAVGGYVVGPGSYVNHKGVRGIYEIEVDAAIAPLPDGLRSRLRTRGERSATGPGVVSDLDAPSAIEQAKARLSWAEPAVEGCDGDNATYKLACNLLDFGLTIETAHELMLHSTWNHNSVPPWGDEELRRKVENAWQYRQEAVGRHNAADGFVPIEMPKLAPGELPSNFSWTDDLPTDAQVSWLVDEAIPNDSIGFLAGDPGTGKTFLVVHLALCLAFKLPFFGREIAERCGTVIFAAEGPYSVKPRLRAASEHILSGVELPPGANLSRQPIVRQTASANMLTESGLATCVEQLKHVAKSMHDKYGVPLRLVVIDTLAAGFSVADENHASETSKVTRAMQAIARALGATVLATHHFGKDKDRGMRGSTALRANADFVLTIKKKGELNLDKCRDAPEGPIGSFSLPVVTIGRRENGKPITSRYVKCLPKPQWPNASEGFETIAGSESTEQPRSNKPNRTLEKLVAAFDRIAGETEQGPVADVRTEFLAHAEGKVEAKRQAFNRARKAALEAGWQLKTVDGQDYLARPTGTPVFKRDT